MDDSIESTLDICKRPTLILKFLEMITGLVIFSVLLDNGKQNGVSVYDRHNGAVSFAIGVGVMQFLTAFLFFVLEIILLLRMDVGLVTRKIVAFWDLFFADVMSFLAIGAFAYTTHQWLNTERALFDTAHQNAARTGIAFLFFAILLWTASTVIGYKVACKQTSPPVYEAMDEEEDGAGYASFIDQDSSARYDEDEEPHYTQEV